MTRILRLLLIAAIALPIWQPMAAQEVVPMGDKPIKRNLAVDKQLKISKLIDKTKVVEQKSSISDVKSLSLPHASSYRAPKSGSPKAGKQIYDYYGKYVLETNLTTNVNLPVNTSYLTDNRDEGQMIYRTSALGLESGVQIISITFFSDANIPDLGNNNVTLSIGETNDNNHQNGNYTTITSYRALTSEVYSGSLTKSDKKMTFTFSEPYTYSGKNLIVDLVVNSGDVTQSISWLGVQPNNNNYTNGSGCYARTGYNYRTNFLPTMYVEYRKPHEGTVSARTIEVLKPEQIAAKSYTWPIKQVGNVAANSNTSNLNEPATDPDQMIAMMRWVYMDPTIPGNLKRGFATDGSDTGETNQAVYYQGVGGLKFVPSQNNYIVDSKDSYDYDDIYGWGIPGNAVDVQNLTLGSSEYTYTDWSFPFFHTARRDSIMYYTYLDLNEYKPEKEGLTLLLVEMKEDYADGSNWTIHNSNDYATEYDRLRAYFQNTIKSVRVISEAKRTGTGLETGTLFKIDCDKMNKFFLLAKGQLHLDHNSLGNSDTKRFKNDFSVPPFYYVYTTYDNHTEELTENFNGFSDYNTGELFWHMFEQFSPTMYNASAGANDLYQDMINMESFPVIHDCLGITRMNHQFLMYGSDSKDADCQDVRDMMFFVPDYRMLYHDGRGSSTQEYLNYHPDLQPSVGMYVIRQNEITATTEADDYYMLNLNWVTNLDNFLPGEYQEFELLQLVVDENGNESYIPVYYMNAQGQYTQADGVTLSDTPVPIKLHLGPGAEKNYPYVYVKRLSRGQQVTYAIRGRDKDPVTGESFLSLQTSNRQSFIVPGTDPTELVMLNNATYYSRYNPQTEKNCYSNKIMVGNYIGGLTNDFIQGGNADPTIFKFYRMLSEDDENPTLIGTAKIVGNMTATGGKLQITMSEESGVQSPSSEYPYGSETGMNKRAGYHANKTDQFNFTYYKNSNGEYITDANGNKYVDFGKDFYVYDNFVEDLHKDNLPNRFFYKVEFNTAKVIRDKDNNNLGRTAHGNSFSVPVYRTATDINGSFTFDQVKGDTSGDLELPEAINFDVNLRRGSKTELYRYAAYRWMNTPANQRFILSVVDGDDETDEMPQGTAGNQDEYFTVSMNNVNEPEYYETHDVQVAATGYTKATFIDNLPIKKTENPAAVYDYAPVIEWYASGFDATRNDYNTYGGPLQSAAIGKMKVSVAQADEEHPVMSEYSWTDANGDKYAYYNFCLKFDQKSLPDDTYEIYKIRAWREVPTSMQGEEYSDLFGRMGAKVNFEEITYPDCDASDQFVYQLGSGAKSFVVHDANNQEQTYAGYTGTFGARKLRTEGNDEQGVIEELSMNFVVRMYFTKKSNLQTTQNGAPRLRAEGDQNDAKYFIVEQTIPHTVKANQVVTGIQNLTARQVVSEKYYNPAGIESSTPFQGVNIVVTRYSDGSTTTTKILR